MRFNNCLILLHDNFQSLRSRLKENYSYLCFNKLKTFYAFDTNVFLTLPECLQRGEKLNHFTFNFTFQGLISNSPYCLTHSS